MIGFEPEVKSLDEIEILGSRELGSGYMSKVKEGRHRTTGKAYAVKMVNLSEVRGGDLEALRRELEIHKGLKHDNIVKLHNAFESNGCMYIILEHIKLGNLYDFTKKEALSEDELISIFYQVTLAVDYLHREKVLHRDISPRTFFWRVRVRPSFVTSGFLPRTARR